MINTGQQQNTSHMEFKIKVNEIEISFTQPKASGRQILEKACKEPIECYTLYQKLKSCDFEKVSLDEIVDLSNSGIEHFVTKEPEVYNYTVDGEPETTDKKLLTPLDILKLDAINSNEL